MRKTDERFTRRGFLQKMAVAGAITVGAGYLIGCKPQDMGEKKGAGGKAEGAAETDVCTDLSALSEADIKTREGLAYVDKSTQAGKNCANCSLYQPDQYAPAECGGCTVIKGPVMAAGNCTAWAAKAG